MSKSSMTHSGTPQNEAEAYKQQRAGAAVPEITSLMPYRVMATSAGNLRGAVLSEVARYLRTAEVILLMLQKPGLFGFRLIA